MNAPVTYTYSSSSCKGFVPLQVGNTTGRIKLTPSQVGGSANFIKPTPSQVGRSATVGVQGTGISVNTDSSGNYILNDVPAGSQVIEAFLTSNPATTQPLNTTVVSDATVIVNFNFA